MRFSMNYHAYGLMSTALLFICAVPSTYAQELRLTEVEWVNDLGQPIPPFVRADLDIVGAPDDDTTMPIFTNTTTHTINYGPMIGNIDVIDTIETFVTAGPIAIPITWSGNVNVPVDQSEFPIVIDGNVSTGFSFIPGFSGLWRSDGAVTLTFRAFPSDDMNPDESLSVTVSATAAMQNSNFTAAVARFSVFKPDGTREQVVAFGGSSNAVDLSTTFELKVNDDNDTFRVVLDVKTLDTTLFAAASARIENFRIEAIPALPEASYIIVPIHGQVFEAAVLPELFLNPPAWNGDVTRIAGRLANEINDQRTSAKIPPIKLIPIIGNWAQLTKPGFEQIVSSRIKYLYIEAANPPAFIRDALFTAAFHIEQDGRYFTERSSRTAASIISNRIATAIAEQRQINGPAHPVFVDLIGHSRGGAVSGEVQRILGRKYLTDPHVSISWTILDGIDPTQRGTPPLKRPLALAGDLLNDPLLLQDDRLAGDIKVTNFYAQFALIDGESGFYGPLVSSAINLVFGVQPDSWLKVRGYPRGRSRPGLVSPQDDHIFSFTSHTSIVDALINSYEQAVVGVPAQPASIVASTFLGDIVQEPLTRIKERRQLRVANLDKRKIRDNTPFTVEGTVDSACAFLDAAEVLSADMGFREFMPDLQFLLERYTYSSVANQFPTGGVWETVSGKPIVACDDIGIALPAFVLDSGAMILQQLNQDSLDSDSLRVRLEVAMTTPDSVLVAMLDGPGLSSEHAFSTDDAPALLAPFVIEYEIERQDGSGCTECLDTLTVSGDGILLLEATVIAAPLCPSDLNGDNVVDTADLGILIGQFGTNQPEADINGDGIVDMADLGSLIAEFGSACP